MKTIPIQPNRSNVHPDFRCKFGYQTLIGVKQRVPDVKGED